MAPSSRRKRQTRLTFNPLSSSSPAKTQYDPAVQERLSGIGYDGPSAKKRKVTFEDEEDEFAENINVLPTPAKSSQAPTQTKKGTSKARDTSTQPSSSAKRSKRKSGAQGILDFSNHIGTSLPRETEDKPSPPSARKVRRNPFRGADSSGLPSSGDSTSSSEASEDDDAPPTSSPPRTQRRLRSQPHEHLHDAMELLDESDNEPVRKSARKSKTRSAVVISSDEEDKNSNDEDWDSVLGSDADSPKRSGIEEIGEPETSADEVMQSSPMKKPRRSSKPGGEMRVAANGYKSRGDDFVVDDHESDDGEMAAEALSNRRRAKEKRKSKEHSKNSRHSSREDVLEDDGFVVDEEDEEDEIPVRASRNPRATQSDSESGSGDSVIPSSKRRRLSQRKTPKDDRGRQEEEDLAEDLEFLGDAKESPARLRSSDATPKHNPRKEALEEFKRRRAANGAEPSSSAPRPTQRRGRALYDTESEHESGNDGSEEEVEEVDFDDATAHEMFNEDAGEEDFIVEDEDDPLGVPDEAAQLPIEFSHLVRAKAKDLFKYAVEWMVQKKINPAFAITDEVYDLAFKKLNDEVKGLAGSKFMSSAWKPDFTRTLKARPQINSYEVGADGMQHCEACGRKSHPATFQVQFAGKPYSKSTLEDVDNGIDSEDDDDGETYDELGNRLDPENQIYHVGRTCMSNAQTAHALEHWRYHLNEWVVEYLKAEGHLAAEKIVERDSWSTKKRRRYANEVTDEMEEAGEIKRIYHAFKQEVEAAHEAKGSGWERFTAD